ncbi:phosphomannomutase [Vibrio ostreicida]|uniref:phosphomannomutase n=1 Tax=Vibrio ostreicida TaxID=526588 RepID=UPI00097075F2|nr:phosphomannomutase [Vibrio ostreicida]
MLNSSNVIHNSGVQFGTSGARGLVTQFTPEVCAAFVHGFLASIENDFSFDCVAVAIDNRPSSESIANACISALKSCGFGVKFQGVLPTPALAYYSMRKGIPCIMVTGSHIPFDRNGLKFYRPDGEISKADEVAITSSDINFELCDSISSEVVNGDAAREYIERYTSVFPSDLLSGKRVGIYEHSSSGRDIYNALFSMLGADVVSLGRSDGFVPIDTEAVSEQDIEKGSEWSKKLNLDFMFSTDGDGDRPLVACEDGRWLRGDLLGLLCAEQLGVDALAVPVSCNTLIKSSSNITHVSHTKIGSPYVIAELNELSKTYKSIAGFEANGGFILGSDISINGCLLESLPTRDSVLPALVLLASCGKRKIVDLVAEAETRFTYSDRIQNIPLDKSVRILNIAKSDIERFSWVLLNEKHKIASINLIDGLRIEFDNGDIMHLRPSGNAPELRCYAESNSEKRARYIVEVALNHLDNTDW